MLILSQPMSFGTGPALPAAAGLSFGQAVGAAWASRADVTLVVPAAELRASFSTGLAAFAVAERLVGLAVVIVGDGDDVTTELALRGFACETAGSPSQLAGALARARGRGRPAAIVYGGPLAPVSVVAPAPPSGDPLAVPFDAPARDVGAFAAGIALAGRVPLAVAALADFDALKPALRLGLPGVFLATEDLPPRDALWSLRLVPGVEVWRPTGAEHAAAIVEAAARRPHPTVVVLGPDPTADAPPDPLAAAALLADAPPGAPTLVATGAEVALALAVRAEVEARVVAVACVERLTDVERRRLIGGGPVVVLEAGVGEPWRALLPDARVLCRPDELDVAHVVSILGNGRRARAHAGP